MAQHNQEPDRTAAEGALIALVASGEATRTALGDDALWSPRAPGASVAQVPRAA
jgi:hypothetical protein